MSCSTRKLLCRGKGMRVNESKIAKDPLVSQKTVTTSQAPGRSWVAPASGSQDHTWSNIRFSAPSLRPIKGVNDLQQNVAL